MAIKNHLSSFSRFSLKEAIVLAIAMIGRKLETLAPRYNLVAKTKFDFYQHKNITVTKVNQHNLLSFLSKFSGKQILFKIRRKATDIVIFDEILLNAGYQPLIQICNENKIRPSVIVDAGANIGSSVIFFKDVFPEATIICIEPEANNLLQLKENVQLNNFSDIHFVEGGLWHKDELLQMKDDFRGGTEKELSFSLSQPQENESQLKAIKGYSVKSILNNFNIAGIDLFKIDIEGAEAHLFDTYEKTLEILNITKVLAIELHDESIDRFKFTGFIEKAGYHHVTFGEVTYVYKPVKL